MLLSFVPFRPGRAIVPASCFLVFWLPIAALASASQQSGAAEKVPVLEGTVTDMAGAPLPGVVLRLEPGEAGSPSDAAVATATTDREGNYVLRTPGTGRYTLRALAAGFRPYVLGGLVLDRPGRRRVDIVPQPSAPGPPDRSAAVEFSDAPNFTVAGITDRSNMGLHGSDASTRTSDALARETAGLKPGSTESTAPGAGAARRLAAEAKEKDGDPLGAVREYQAAARIDPSEENYFAWGSELLLHRAGQAAVEVFSNGARLHPGSARMLAGLGAAYYSTGRYGEAAAQLCRASGVDPADPAPYLFLGRMELASTDPLACSDLALSRFAASQPANPQANFFYGLVLWKEARGTQDQAKLDRALRLFQRAVELKPDYAEVYLQLGLLYNARGERQKALAAFERAAGASPDLSAVHYQLSLAYRRSGDAAKAEREMKTYDGLRQKEQAAAEKERRELRQFVIDLKEGNSPSP